MAILWEIVKWPFRVALWILILPVGLWRSVKHGQRKRDKKLAKAIGDAVHNKPA